MAFLPDLCVSLRACLCGVVNYASAQALDFLDLGQKFSFLVSLSELHSDADKRDVQDLLQYGGFPEPLLRAEEKFWRRWQRERIHRVIYEDIRDLENIKEISLLELLAEELPNRVGAPLSVKNLKEMLQVAHETVERWLKIFERRPAAVCG